MTVFSCPVCHNVLLVAPHLPPQTTPAAPPAPDAAAMPNGDPVRAKLVNLKARCTRTTGKVWELVKAVAARTQPCTLQELATDLGAPAKSVLSWRRILGRCCHPKRLNISVIGRAAGKYLMTDETRRIVSEIG